MSDPSAEAAPPRREPFFKLPAVILALLAIMIAVHAWLSFSNQATQQEVIYRFGFVPARYAPGGEAHFGGGVLGLILPFFTHLFIHGNLTHIGFNALWLMAMGTPVARRLGAVPFLAFFFLCGVAGAATHLAVNLGSTVPVVGASGAIAGCMGAALRVMFSPDARYFSAANFNSGSLAALFDRRIVIVSVVWLVLNYVIGSGLVPMPGQGTAGIAWEAHIGGYFAGLLTLPLFDRWAGHERELPPIEP